MQRDKPMFIKLTLTHNKNSIYINSYKITSMIRNHSENYTSIVFDNENYIQVDETPEKIIEIIDMEMRRRYGSEEKSSY